MKKQIVQVSVLQSSRVMAALYFVISLPITLAMLIPTLMGSAPGASIFTVIMMPILYAFFGFLFSLFGAWIYNLIAARIGGFEFQTVEVGADPAQY
jgi:hypothetical protein